MPEKGIRYLVKAFKDVKTDKKLVIAGGSSDTDSFMVELKERAKDDNRIIFTGFVQGQMLDELYSNAYIYTLPSDLEGMPLSLLEAMSYGNCCLVSDIPECAEVVEDKALIFQKFDIEAIEKDFNIEKEQPVFLYCDTGSTSMLAAKKLDSVGIHAYSVVGGIMFYKGYLEKEKNDLWTMVRTS